jgi:hypothetical protein
MLQVDAELDRHVSFEGRSGLEAGTLRAGMNLGTRQRCVAPFARVSRFARCILEILEEKAEKGRVTGSTKEEKNVSNEFLRLGLDERFYSQ